MNQIVNVFQRWTGMYGISWVFVVNLSWVLFSCMPGAKGQLPLRGLFRRGTLKTLVWSGLDRAMLGRRRRGR